MSTWLGAGLRQEVSQATWTDEVEAPCMSSLSPWAGAV